MILNCIIEWKPHRAWNLLKYVKLDSPQCSISSVGKKWSIFLFISRFHINWVFSKNFYSILALIKKLLTVLLTLKFSTSTLYLKYGLWTYVCHSEYYSYCNWGCHFWVLVYYTLIKKVMPWWDEIDLRNVINITLQLWLKCNSNAPVAWLRSPRTSATSPPPLPPPKKNTYLVEQWLGRPKCY